VAGHSIIPPKLKNDTIFHSTVDAGDARCRIFNLLDSLPGGYPMVACHGWGVGDALSGGGLKY
jgi:hypothetical protein